VDAVAVGPKALRVHERPHDPVTARRERTAVHNVHRLVAGGAKAKVNSEARLLPYGVLPCGVPAVPSNNQTS